MTGKIRGIELHPNDHLVSSAKQHTYDVIVLGSGPSGRNLAARTAAAGLRTLIVEEELVGGDCPFWACIPSKALLRPAEAIEAAKQISGAREMIRERGGPVDVESVFHRRDRFVNDWNDGGLVDLLASQNCDIIRGRGVLTGTNKVEVTSQSGDALTISAVQAVVLATGSSPVIPNISGLNNVQVWTPRDATAANEIPEHLVIIGGGVVGCEMATFYGAITKVTLISSANELLPRFEPEASKRVRAALRSKEVMIHLSSHIQSIEPNTTGTFKLNLSTGKEITGSKILIAVGRKPNIENIGLEQLGVAIFSGLSVDDSLCVAGTGWLYAVGDANSRNPLTHMGVYQARAAASSIIAKAKHEIVNPQPWDEFSATADHVSASQVVMTDPNVASAGLTLLQAKAKGYNVKQVTSVFEFPGAWLYAEFNYDGWAQWNIDVDREVLLGATFVGRQASDLLHPSTVAIVGQVPIKRLWHAVACFPTMSEIYTALLNASGY